MCRRTHYQWILHLLALCSPCSRGGLGAYSLTSLGPFLPLEPQWFPASLSPAQQDLAPYAFQHNFLENETTSFFFFSDENFSKHMLKGKIIKSCN